MSQTPFAGARIFVLACARALEAEAVKSLDGFRLLRLPCSSKAEPELVLKAFQAGADGVALIPCPSGACQYVEGNRRAEALTRGVTALLQELAIPAERFGLYPLDPAGRTGVAAFLAGFKARVEARLREGGHV